MDKNAIKKYAVWARRELIEKVSQKALQYGIEEGKELDPKVESIDGVLLSDVEIKQRQALIDKINESGYMQVMEEVAYTWFNRFIALRFMEVNGYLPSHVRVFSNEAGEFQPQIMSEALHLEIEGIDNEKVYELKNNNRDDDLFKYLLITQCNALSSIFPKMFQKIADYTELLLPDYLLREGSVIEQMVNQKDGIPEADWQDQVQIIGWLYQYYNTEPKDKVFADLKKNVKITKETIPAATQLFTPDWIVHYMVENSLGRLWLKGHPNETLKTEWEYYIDQAEQNIDVKKTLELTNQVYSELRPEEIRCIDPCMGSGHILCVLFDVLVRIYEDYGYTAREAVASIVENNIWGLDIDERAAQLAYFAVMMKARQYDRRFFTRGIQPNVYAIQESNGLQYYGDYNDFLLEEKHQNTIKYLFDVFIDAKEYGSILEIEPKDYSDFISSWRDTAEQTYTDIRMAAWHIYANEKVISLANQAKALSQKYHVVVTNPPYMGSTGMGGKLSSYVKKSYADSKGDLFAVFMERAAKMLNNIGFQSMITQHSWMFLSSYEKLRHKICSKQIVNMIHLGARAFDEIGGEVVQTTAFVLSSRKTAKYKGTYYRLLSGTSEKEKRNMFFAGEGRYFVDSDDFVKIPGTPIAYWIDNRVYECYSSGEKMEQLVHGFQGMITGNNDYFLRLWHEISFNNIVLHENHANLMNPDYTSWVPYKKGGGSCRWYGNSFYVLRWEKSGKGLTRARTENSDYYLREGVTWSYISTNTFSANYYPQGYLWDVHGSSIFTNRHEDLMYYIALMNSCVGNYLLTISNPTLSFQVENILSLPVIKNEEYFARVVELAEAAIELCKKGWDYSEISWEYQTNALVRENNTLKEAFNLWKEECEYDFYKLKEIEEEINEIFIRAYNLNNVLEKRVDEDSINYPKSDICEDVKKLISYAVGCMFGRYSLDEPGLIYAGGLWNNGKYKTFIPDSDAIIPICDDEYFADDIVGRFVEFMKIVYGEEYLEENLKFVAEAIGGNGSAREIIRNYFINDFYADHLKLYQKRPIYWMFESGKKNGFKCLIYMHRYQPDTIARIRTDYVHEQQARYRTAIEEMSNRIERATGSDKVKYTKKLNSLKEQDEEIHVYEEKIHHLADQMISLNIDDGVKHNYEIFKDVLAKLK